MNKIMHKFLLILGLVVLIGGGSCEKGRVGVAAGQKQQQQNQQKPQRRTAPPYDTMNVNNLPVVKDTSVYKQPKIQNNELIVILNFQTISQ
jgi:hypothetical protein